MPNTRAMGFSHRYLHFRSSSHHLFGFHEAAVSQTDGAIALCDMSKGHTNPSTSRTFIYLVVTQGLETRLGRQNWSPF